ncbi:BPL-N domain-containing protein [Tomitella gaofuii]|uniref:BPL-N domain-containing protein n=1 Tax=Tomitella gaofuii TaxID=2760083 RepID=UPI002E2C6A9F|nr:BPL-N domain-containing protein [Tomitella gaofuii]
MEVSDIHGGGQRSGGTTRRRFLIGSALTAATIAGAGPAGARHRGYPLALVYRGPASVPGCPEAVAGLLESCPTPYTVRYCGPDERRQLSSASLAQASLFAQPGGGSIADAWPHLRDHAAAVRGFVAGGGAYLGFCLGAYLAAERWGYGVFSGEAVRYIRSPGSTVQDTDDTIVDIDWRGEHKTMYFQDGPQFTSPPEASAAVLGRYNTGAIAALVAAYGSGAVGLVGPHPEANRWWYGPGLTNPQGIDFSMGYDLVTTTAAVQYA